MYIGVSASKIVNFSAVLVFLLAQSKVDIQYLEIDCFHYFVRVYGASLKFQKLWKRIISIPQEYVKKLASLNQKAEEDESFQI